jgi:FMN phosphatase YigB (HAD superfamily)
LFFERALSEANCSAQEAVYLGDTWDTDVEGGMGAGILTYWYRRGQTERIVENEFYGGAIDDLMGFVQL